MTRHNLREHLTWLLRSENANSPPADLTPLQTNIASSTPTGADDNSPQNTLDHNIVAADVEAENVAEARRLPEFVRPSLPARSGNCEAVGDMAKLQTGPRSATKSRLLSQASPTPLETSTLRAKLGNSTSLKDQYSAHYGDSVDSKCLLATR